MNVLVANLGSTSFKYRLFDMTSEVQLARGGVERIGSPESDCFVEMGGRRHKIVSAVPDHAVAVRQCLNQLTDPENGCLKNASQVAAIGFKAVHGGGISGAQRVSSDVLAEMEKMNAVAPAHNPPYIAAMQLLAEKLPDIPLVAAFETGFHQTIPDRHRYYAIPKQWSDDFHIKRWGFHGASHRYIAERTSELLGRSDARVISCHLGGSSSLCAIRDGASTATTMGMSPQSGLPQNNRVGDFDAFALPLIMERTGKTLTEALDHIANHGGLLGISGVSSDIRDIEEAAANGNDEAKLAIDVFVTETRRHLGGLLVELGGADALVFTGGIGENGTHIRSSICRDLQQLGMELDESANSARSSGERSIHSASSGVQIWVIPTNEEIVVARQTKQLLEG